MFESVIWAFQIRLHFDLTPSGQKVMMVQSQLAGKVVAHIRLYNLKPVYLISGAKQNSAGRIHLKCIRTSSAVSKRPYTP